MLETTRTYRAKIVNHQQVQDDLDNCGFSASKLWNVARYYTQGRWDDDGEIPDDGELNPNSRNTNDIVTSILSQVSEFSKSLLSRSPVGTKHANAETKTPTHPATANTETTIRALP